MRTPVWDVNFRTVVQTTSRTWPTYARTTDLRDDIEGEQNIYLYTVYAALGSVDPNARNLLKEAARQGGFDDHNGNGWPDGDQRWDDTG